MKVKHTNKKWFTLIEVVVAMSLFVIFITTRFIIDNNSTQAYVDSVKSNNLELMTNDLYAYLYSYKKSYGTNYFINLITQWDSDNNCNWNDFNWNWVLNDEIDEYCFFYPYLSWSTIKFNKWIINNNNATIDSVYLLDNNNGWYDWLSYKKIFGGQKSSVIIALKEDFNNSDKYVGFIWIFDISSLKYIYKQKVLFE